MNLDFEIADGALPKGWHTGGGPDAAKFFKVSLDHEAHHGASSATRARPLTH